MLDQTLITLAGEEGVGDSGVGAEELGGEEGVDLAGDALVAEGARGGFPLGSDGGLFILIQIYWRILGGMAYHAGRGYLGMMKVEGMAVMLG